VIFLFYRITLYVLGICCVDSLSSIKKEIEGVVGVLSFKGSSPKGKLVIEFKPNSVSALDIVDKIEDQGFAVIKKVQREYMQEMYN
jgi:copper chaperone CopZ